jgi:hypothetical protein
MPPSPPLKASELATAVSSTLQELVAAAVCFGAVSHPTYKDPRKVTLLKEAEARLRKAAVGYHGVVVGRTVVKSEETV